MQNVIDALIELSTKKPQPSTWRAAVEPLARRYETARLRHLAQLAEHMALADQLSRINMTALSTKVTREALPLIGRLTTLKRDLRAALDSDTRDARLAIRSATGARSVGEFESALESAQKYVPLAESLVERVDVLVSEIHGLTARLALVPFVAEAYQLRPRPGVMVDEPVSR
jgi:hypothetical protein